MNDPSSPPSGGADRQAQGPAVVARTRILVVDDEPAILSSLGTLLRRDRHRWDVVFANGGAAALLELAKNAFDIVITDMRMPDIDGAMLLEAVKQRSPRTVRIMLSGHAESEDVVRAMPLLHEFLAKPCDIKTLRGVIERWSDLISAPASSSTSLVVS